jgi:Transposase DDE domain
VQQINQRRIRTLITTENFTLVTLLLRAIERVKTQTIFDRDTYESRRKAMKGARLLKVLAFFQMLSDPGQREIERVVDASQEAQKALGGRVPRNTLSNALMHRDLEQMIEAWMMILQYYSPYIKQMGKKYVRIAAVDASLIKLSLAAFSWATYREKTGAAKITCVLDWVKGVPQQFVFTASGKIHDLKATAALRWSAGWTYLFDRGYFSFDLLTTLLNVGAHFVIRLKQGVEYRIIRSNPVPDVKLPAGLRAIKFDQIVSLPGWASDVILRLVVYQLTDGKIIRVLTSRHDLSALSIALLYKERWSIEKWWRWLKRIYKVKEPLGESENALPLQIVAAFVTDLVLRAFKHCSGFKGTLYDFVKTCREIALIPISGVIGRMRQALMAAAISLELLEALPQEQT